MTKYSTEPRPRGGLYILLDGARVTVAEDESAASRVITRLARIDRAGRGCRWISDGIAESDDHVHVTPDHRYVVVFAVGYEDRCAPTPAIAADLALDRTRDGRRDTTWTIYDRHTGEVHQLEQHTFEGSAL